jgi:nitric oxide reductase subunit B
LGQQGSPLPVGLPQTVAAVNEGTWYARSAEFMQMPLMQTLRWMRVPGDTLFALGALALGWFMLGLLTGRSIVAPTLPPPLQPAAGKCDLAATST